MTDPPQSSILSGEYILMDPPNPHDHRFRYVGSVDNYPSQFGAPVQRVSTDLTILRDGVEVTVKAEPGYPLYVDLNTIHLSAEGARQYREAVMVVLAKIHENDLSVRRRSMSKRAFFRWRGKRKAERKRMHPDGK